MPGFPLFRPCHPGGVALDVSLGSVRGWHAVNVMQGDCTNIGIGRSIHLASANHKRPLRSSKTHRRWRCMLDTNFCLAIVVAARGLPSAGALGQDLKASGNGNDPTEIGMILQKHHARSSHHREVPIMAGLQTTFARKSTPRSQHYRHQRHLEAP